MHFSSDILIKRNKSFFIELKEKYGIEYIDSYMISGLYGYMCSLREPNFNEKEDEANDISLPRSVLIRRVKKLDYIWSLIYLLSVEKEGDNIDYFKKVFESNDDNTKMNCLNIDRVRIFHEYALGGISLFYDNIVGKHMSNAIPIEDCLQDLIESVEKGQEIQIEDLLKD